MPKSYYEAFLADATRMVAEYDKLKKEQKSKPNDAKITKRLAELTKVLDKKSLDRMEQTARNHDRGALSATLKNAGLPF